MKRVSTLTIYEEYLAPDGNKRKCKPLIPLLLILFLTFTISCKTTPQKDGTQAVEAPNTEKSEPQKDVSQVVELSKKREPSKTVEGLEVADGLEVTLFAAEPMLLNPTNIDIDARGRVWVSEAVNYRPKLNPQNPTRAEGDRIVILEDTDGDGKADNQKVFYQGTDINAALGIWVMGNKVIVSVSPNVFIFTDTDGDDKADKKEVLFTGIGGEQHDHAVHAFIFGPDGKLYFNFGNEGKQIKDSQGNPVVDQAGNPVMDNGKPYRQGMVFRVNPDGSDFEVLGHNFRNNYEVTVDSYGTMWQSDNDDDGNQGVRINYVMDYGNYGYQDEITGAGWRASRTGMAEEIPLRHWHLNDPGVVPNLLQTGAGSPTGITVYEGRLLPKIFWDEIIHSDAGPNVVRAYPVTKDGAGYKAEIVNIVKGTDKWFRPSDVCVAPDGSLMIADWYDPGVGGHQMGDLTKGRIYRVAPPGTPYIVPELDLSDPEGAMAALKNPNLSRRYLAWQKLHEWGKEAEPALLELWKSENPRERARALWLLAKINGRGQHYVETALKDPNSNIRITGLRVARQLKLDLIPYVKQVVRDPSPQVRREAAIALRYTEAPDKAAELWAALAQQHNGKDRWYLEALGIGAALHWDKFFEVWLEEVGDRWNTSAGRDIVWRARAEAAMPLLAQLIDDPETSPSERLRYFRAFDFHTGPSKPKVLMTLLEGEHPDQAQITALALHHLGDKSLLKLPKVEAALQRALTTADGTQRFVDLVGKYELLDQNKELLELAIEKPDSAVGVEAVKLLLKFGGSELINKALSSGEEQTVVAALTVLGNYEDQQSKDLIQSVITNQKYPLNIRQLAVKEFGTGWSGEERLLSLVENGELSEDLKPTAAVVLFTAYRPNIQEEAAKYLDKPTGIEDKALAPIETLVTKSGDPQLGKTVFAQTCIACHEVNGTGIDFGPDLSEIGNKLPKEALYTSILHPNAGISFGYEGYIVKKKDGSQIMGFIASETNDKLDIKMPGGFINSINKSDIASRIKMENSLMPSSLEQTMNEKELVSLVEYLTTLKKKEAKR